MEHTAECRYSDELMDRASKLDAAAEARGEITKYARDVVEKRDRGATVSLLEHISKVIGNENTSRDIKIIAKSLKNSILMFYGYESVRSMCNDPIEEDEDTRTLGELLLELDQLVGLEKVKAKVNDLIAFQKVQLLREGVGLKSQKETLHMAFIGNPGTGKTTVARIIGRIYKQLGLLSKGHFIEVSRTDLIAGYQGQTALKVKDVIERAKGGVLFIDEAYSITENDHSDSYGRECLTELTKALEDYRNDLVVIVAGYTDPMRHFFESNPGLRSRFNTFLEFDDYSADELMEMLLYLCDKNDYRLDEVAVSAARSFIQDQARNKEDNFANGRLVRNVFEWLITKQAQRVCALDTPDRETLSTISADDAVFEGFGS